MEKNQILLEISKDKKSITVTLGDFPSMSFESCPKRATLNFQNVINTYLEETGLKNLEEWKSENCIYEDGTGCSECKQKNRQFQ